MTNSISIFKRPGIVVLAFLAGLTVSRLLLIATHWERVAPTDGVVFILLQGIRFDIILTGMLFGLVFLLKPWLHTLGFLRRIGNLIIPLYMGLAIPLAFFVEAATVSFIAQYDSRPNYLFVEYLAYPREVLAMLSGSHLLELIGAMMIAVFLAWFIFNWLRKDPDSDKRTSLLFCLLASPVILVLGTAMIRSTLDHRPVNPSIAVFSQDSMVNQLALNSPYSLIYAIYEQKRDSAHKGVRYGAMSDDEVLDIVLAEAGITPEEQIDPATPTLHHQVATRERDRPLNLVIILEESLGAEFVGSLGGKGLTPRLDELADEGIWFERLYATGTRTVRGIEAVGSGFTPTPRRSVVKLAETQENFFTLAELLQKQGYTTSFIYGGEAHFDNMKRFFLNNGYQSVIDEKDYPDPVFHASWGVSDEDLFTRAHREFEKASGQPFFSLLLTSSNHEPFDIPDGRVSVEEGPDGPLDTAIKYADYSLGYFFDLARESSYWEDTVFLVVADHNSRVYGDQLVPIDRFHVPGVIVGATIEPRRVRGITSQIDMLPTLLSLIGVSSDHPAIGRDLTLPEYADGSGRAMMQFNALQAYMEDDRVVVMQPDLEPMSFRLKNGRELILADESDPELERRALGYSLWGPMMIRLKVYHD